MSLAIWGARVHEGYHLLAWQAVEDTPKVHEALTLRELPSDEVAEIQTATALLLQLIPHSPYTEFVQATDSLASEISGMSDAWEASSQFPNAELREVNRVLRTWLAAFRAFDDRTSHYLSKQFGRKSAVRSLFKEALSYEYDSVFEYRLATQLRNMSLHVADVINRADATVSEGSDGELNHRLTLSFNGPDLVSEFEAMNAKVRKELSSLTADVDLEDVIVRVSAACERVYAKLILALEEEIVHACSVLESIHREALEVGASGATVTRLPDGERGAGSMHVRHVDVGRATVARAVLRQSHALSLSGAGSGRDSSS